MIDMNSIVLSCEHAGGEVPPAYRDLFKDHPSILSTHRAVDIGALEISERVAGYLSSPLFVCSTTRLLIDANRSLGHPKIFSEFSKPLADEDKSWLIRNIYRPYRESVGQFIEKRIQAGGDVLHLSMHSFVPVLDGRVRNADIGLLYDPSRPREKSVSKALQHSLHRDTDLRIRLNYPYRGISDGFTTSLRKVHGQRRYAGIEIELNQSLLTGDGSSIASLSDAFCRALACISHKDS